MYRRFRQALIVGRLQTKAIWLSCVLPKYTEYESLVPSSRKQCRGLNHYAVQQSIEQWNTPLVVTMSPSLTFDESAAEFVLEAHGKAVDEEGYVVDAETGERVETPEGDEIEASEFAGIEKGSTLFLDSNFESLVEHVKRRRSE